jgi:hypothetical protein
LVVLTNILRKQRPSGWAVEEITSFSSSAGHPVSLLSVISSALAWGTLTYLQCFDIRSTFAVMGFGEWTIPVFMNVPFEFLILIV